MPGTKHITALFFLVLFFQASTCWNSRSKNLSIPIPHQVPDKPLSLDDPTKGDPASDLECEPGLDLDAEFDPEFHFYASSNSSSSSNHGYDSGYETDSDSKLVSKQPASPLSRPKKGNLDFDFENWIETMRERADQKRNITWHLSGDALTRIVNSQGSGSLYAPEDYVVQGLNIYRAANKICALHEQDGAVFSKSARALVHYYYTGLEQSEDLWIKMVKKINKWVVSRLQTKVFKDENAHAINSKLRLAENYVGLDDVHYNVTTTFTIGDTKFALEDKKAFPPTAKQKQAYQNRYAEPWYKRLPPFEQKFIDAYLPKLSDGNHYLPTQLRSLPGCRNAYQKRVLAYDKANNETVLGRYYHSGSLASPIEWKDKATDLQITKDNWDQITSQDKNVAVTSLNYNMNVPFFKQLREKKIVEDTRQVVGDDKFMNVSINGIGTSSNVCDRYNELVEGIIRNYEQQYPDLCKSFKKDPKDNSFVSGILNFFKEHPKKYRNQQIEQIKDPKHKKFFELLVELEKRAETFSVWNDLKQSKSLISGNPNATTCAIYIACMALLNHDKTIPTVLFSCKSGKDRTGLMSLLVDKYIMLMSHLAFTQDEVINLLIRTGHYQFLPSVNGGMAGRLGAKFVPGILISSQFDDLFFLKAARLTYIGLDKEQPEQIEAIE